MLQPNQRSFPLRGKFEFDSGDIIFDRTKKKRKRKKDRKKEKRVLTQTRSRRIDALGGLVRAS